MKIWPQIEAKMALTQFSLIASYYHGILAATEIALVFGNEYYMRL